VLLETSGRKCSFIRRAVDVCSLSNVEVVHARAEAWEPGLGRFDLALVRAVSGLGVVVEYAAPLLKVGGALVAWRGQRDPEAEFEAGRAAKALGLEAREIRHVAPFPGAQHRHLHLFSKVRDTPPRFPRRSGQAAKRPLGRRRMGPAG
jgi:16S rRNA (guanine527-N7)-methyltransferase